MPLSDEQPRKLRKHILKMNMNNKHEVKRMIVLLLCCQNGICSTEVRSILADNVMLDKHRIKLTHTKTSNVRYAYLDNVSIKVLTKYIELFKPVKYLFDNPKTHNIMSRDNIRKYCRNLSDKLGFRIATHILRSTFATLTLANGCDIESVRILMGHRRLSTTEQYLHMVDSRIYDNYRKFNLLKNLESHDKPCHNSLIQA